MGTIAKLKPDLEEGDNLDNQLLNECGGSWIEVFVEGIMQGLPHKVAFERAKPNTKYPAQNAYKALKNPQVQYLMQQLLNESTRNVGINFIIDKLLEEINNKGKGSTQQGRLNAIKLLAKIERLI